jgi:cell division cycle 2-like protein
MKRLMVQLVSAVEFMHDKFYIHRDLKTSNLLLGENGKLVVCDFGMARKYSG